MQTIANIVLIMSLITTFSSNDIIILNALSAEYKDNENLIKSSTIQKFPCISVDNNGNFTIVWEDGRQGSCDIFAQRYSSTGTTLGSNFQINDFHNLYILPSSPCISAAGNGDFIVSWVDGRNSGLYNWNWDIYAQRFANDGTMLGSNFKVNDNQDSTWQVNPSLSVDDNGDCIIVWNDGRSGNDAIYAQRYSSDGKVLSSNFQVNDVQFSSSLNSHPSVSTDSSGNFIITWGDQRNDNMDIYAQRYSNDGTALGKNFKVNDDQDSENQYYPCISVDGDGNFVIVWVDERNNVSDIYAQRYSSEGTAIGSNFRVDDDTTNAYQYIVSISADRVGNFIVAWIDARNSLSFPDIYAQRYSYEGNTLGSNFKVNDDICSEWSNNKPSVSADDDGNFIITFVGGQNDGGDIYAQRYSSDGIVIGSNFKVNDDPAGIDVEEQVKRPTDFALNQNHPNPFNPSTTIEFSLPKPELVTLKIYNILGEEITTVVNGKLQAGNHTYQFDGSNLASGVYLYRIEAGEFHDVKKMVFLN
jgi:hypothetical protein